MTVLCSLLLAVVLRSSQASDVFGDECVEPPLSEKYSFECSSSGLFGKKAHQNFSDTNL